jgi:ArsR family transcriptional regulator
MATTATRATSARNERAGLDDVFKALASEQRREILRILGENTPDPDKTCCAPDELCGCKLAEWLGVGQPTISHHMAILRQAGLVTARRDGKRILYSLRRDVLDRAARVLTRY